MLLTARRRGSDEFFYSLESRDGIGVGRLVNKFSLRAGVLRDSLAGHPCSNYKFPYSLECQGVGAGLRFGRARRPMVVQGDSS